MSATFAGRRAAGFVAKHGSPLDRARAAALLRDASSQVALAQLDADLPDADATWIARLRICDELGASTDARVERVAQQLSRSQAADGGLGAESGDLDARLQRTGLLAGYLAKTPFARPELLATAGDFLASHFAPERVQGFQWENLEAYTLYFANAPHDAGDGVLQWCGRELERGLRAAAFDAVRCVRLLAGCDAHGLPGARLSRAELAEALRAEQAADGGFGLPVAPPPERVEATLGALVGLRHLDAGAR